MANNYDPNDLNFIDDRFPFNLNETLDYNLGIARKLLIQSGYTEEEAENIIIEKKNKYFNKDGTRKDLLS